MTDIILLHGLCGSPQYFDDLAPLLSGRVHRLTLPGHGGTEAGPSTIDAFADWVIDEMARRDIVKPIVLGHSFGGYITTNLVRRYPERLSAFGLIHSTAAADSDEAKQKRDGAIATIKRDGIEPFVNQMIPGVFSKQSDPALIERAKQIGYDTTVDGAIRAQQAIRDRVDETETVRLTALPGIVVYGQFDPNMDEARAFQGANRHTNVTLPVSHMGMLEAPEAEAQRINDWIQKG